MTTEEQPQPQEEGSTQETEEQVKRRKTRADKGLVQATKRDQAVITWMAEMYAVRGDQIRRLLSRFPDKQKPFKAGGLIAETTARDQIARWRRAGWIEYQKVLADQPGWAWVTRRGLQLVGLDEQFTARAPAVTRLDHLFGVNQLRLSLDVQGYEWQSERDYKSKELQKAKKGTSTGPIPDGIVTKGSQRAALEVELSVKGSDELEKKIARLVRKYNYSSGGTDMVPVWPVIWFYVPSERVKTAVEKAIAALRVDERGRVAVVISADLHAASRGR